MYIDHQNFLHECCVCAVVVINFCVYLFSLHAKLNEDEEAAKLYNRFVAQAETSNASRRLITSSWNFTDCYKCSHYLNTGGRPPTRGTRPRPPVPSPVLHEDGQLQGRWGSCAQVYQLYHGQLQTRVHESRYSSDDHYQLILPRVQAKEEGKSLLQEISKMKAAQESTSKQIAADLALIDIDHEFSPIAATGTATWL